MKPGDSVKHIPSGETWVVGWADDRNVYPLGWPETIAERKDCELVTECSEDESVALMRLVAQTVNDRMMTVYCQNELGRRGLLERRKVEDRRDGSDRRVA